MNVNRQMQNNIILYVHYASRLPRIQISVSIYEVVLKHSHVHSFTYFLWLCSHYNSRVIYFASGYMAWKAKNTHCQPLF